VWSKIKSISSIIIGLIIILTGTYAAYRVTIGGWHAYKSLSENAQIAIAVAFLSLIGTLGSLYYTKIKDRQLQIDASHSEKKQNLYNEFVKEIFELIADPTKGDDDEYSLEMRKKFISNSLLWSNPKVLEVYHRFRTNAQKEDTTEAQSTYDLASLFLAFREDLGLGNKNINEKTILEIIYDKPTLESWGLTFEDEKK